MKNVHNLLKAIAIISKYHSNEIVINKPKGNFVGDITKGKPVLHMTSCVAGCINELKDAGFMLDMESGFLSVSDVFLDEDGNKS